MALFTHTLNGHKMNNFPVCKIFILHFFVTCAVLALGLALSLAWYAILSAPNDIEVEFRRSETLQLLQIVIGFTYISVLRSFFDSLQQKTALVAEMKTLYDPNNRVTDEFVDKIIGVRRGGNEQNSWEYWSRKGVLSPWKSVFTKVVIHDNADHGQLFSFLGPWSAIGIFYLFHPPVAYREDANHYMWAIIYSVSISILFAFMVTMWIVERASDFNLLRPGLPFYKCTLQYYMYTNTKHLREPTIRYRSDRGDRSDRSDRPILQL